MSLRRPHLPLAGVVVAAAAILVVLASRVRDWVVMTDELQYAKLATHIGETLSPLPVLRGAHVSSYAQLYPIVISPFYGSMSAPGAFRAAHVVNALLFASAAVPAYLLARRLALGPWWSVVCAGLAVALPWNVQTAFVMTEAVAYPVFLWASLAIVVAVEAPSPRHDVLALAAVVLATLARTQLFVLAIVLPIVVLVTTWREWRRTWERHRVLGVAYAVGLALVLVVAVTGGVSRLFGNYAVAAKGSVLPLKAFEQAGAHIDVIAVGVGLLPLLLGGAWIVENAWRRSVFAVYALTAIVILTLETSSYDARFGGGLAGIRGRYLFYIAPLLVLGMLRLLADGVLPRAGVAAVTAFFAVTVFAHDFPRIAGLYVDQPTAVLDGAIQSSGGTVFVAAVAVVVALALLVVPIPARVLAVAAVALVAAACLGTSALAWSRLLGSTGPSGRVVDAKPAFDVDWVDNVVPKGKDAALVAYPTSTDWSPSAVFWWDVEFWNKTVDRVYALGGHWEYAPFPNEELRIDPKSGVVLGSEHAPEYVVVSEIDSRLRFDAQPFAKNFGLDVLQLPRPYKLAWRVSGIDPDGWIRPGGHPYLRVYAGERGQRYVVSVNLADVAGAQHAEQKGVCLDGPYVDVPLPAKEIGTTKAPPYSPTESGERHVGYHVSAVGIAPANAAC